MTVPLIHLTRKIHYLYYGPSHAKYMFLMRDEKEERKKEASKVKQTNKAKQHSTPKAVTFPRKKNELPRVGLEPTTLYNETTKDTKHQTEMRRKKERSKHVHVFNDR